MIIRICRVWNTYCLMDFESAGQRRALGILRTLRTSYEISLAHPMRTPLQNSLAIVALYFENPSNSELKTLTVSSWISKDASHIDVWVEFCTSLLEKPQIYSNCWISSRQWLYKRKPAPHYSVWSPDGCFSLSCFLAEFIVAERLQGGCHPTWLSSKSCDYKVARKLDPFKEVLEHNFGHFPTKMTKYEGHWNNFQRQLWPGTSGPIWGIWGRGHQPWDSLALLRSPLPHLPGPGGISELEHFIFCLVKQWPSENCGENPSCTSRLGAGQLPK